MTRDKVLNKIEDGTLCTVKFTKKNGEIRTLNGRLGVKKAWKTSNGSGKRFDDSEYNLITIYDMHKQAYRSFKVDSLLELKAHGETYDFTRS